MTINILKSFRYLILLLALISLSACTATPGTTQVKKEVIIPPGKILFFSKTCPHCTLVKNYITDNNINQKLYFVERDINSDQDAYQLMPIIAQRCGILEKDLGVPLFWDGAKCYLGDEKIINYFSNLP